MEGLVLAPEGPVQRLLPPGIERPSKCALGEVEADEKGIRRAHLAQQEERAPLGRPDLEHGTRASPLDDLQEL
jgi:hypothetical protein